MSGDPEDATVVDDAPVRAGGSTVGDAGQRVRDSASRRRDGVWTPRVQRRLDQILVTMGVVLAAHAVWVKVHTQRSGWEAATTTVTGALFLLAGVIRLRGGPTRSTGRLMIAVAVAAFAEDLQLNPHPWVHTLGIAMRTASNGPLTHLVLAFPYGRVRGRAARMVTVTAYAMSVASGLLGLAFTTTADPPNLLLVTEIAGVDEAIDLAATPLGVAVVVLLCWRWLTSSASTRLVIGPVVATSTVTALAALVAGAATTAVGIYRPAIAVFRAGELLIPLALLAGELALHRQRAGTAALLHALGTPMSAEHLQGLLRRTLREPTLELGLWDAGREAFVHPSGAVSRRDTPARTARVRTVLVHEGAPVAVLDHDAAVLLAPDVLDAATAGVRLHLRAEAAAQAAADIVRLERDLHDGVQADLVAAVAMLRLARRGLDARGPWQAESPAVLRHLEQAEAGVTEALADVRRISGGARPSVLVDRGLVAAVRLVADRTPLPVRVRADEGLRWGDPVDATVFFVVHECLANTMRHAAASWATVTLSQAGGAALIEVSDDGAGGARVVPGGGLAGLSGRLGALGGGLTVLRGVPRGTTVRAWVPVEPP